jgi:hypothetical protein
LFTLHNPGHLLFAFGVFLVSAGLAFGRPGTYAYYGAIHPDMKGAVVVGG